MNRDWMSQAECKNHDPEIFFPSPNGRPGELIYRQAQRICAACPVIVQCRAYQKQIGATFGVWGGRMVRSRIYMRDYQPPHGTEAMYRRHRMRGEPPCRMCREAASRAREERRRTA